MKAVLYEKYGPPEVLHLAEVDKPVPKDNEVLIKIRATTVTAADWRARSLDLPYGFNTLGRLVFGISKPRQPILGMEMAGDIEAVGKGVTKFKVGDAVFANSGFGMRAHAQYCCLAEGKEVALKPANLSYEEAAALTFGGSTALSFFKRGNLKSGEKILINGASGAVGSAAVQLAKHFGAKVTAVCSGANIEMVKSLGADAAIDYKQEDFTKNGETYDVIMDNAGSAPFLRCKNSVKPGGRMLLVICDLPGTLKAPWHSMISGKKVIAGPGGGQPEDYFQQLADLAAQGKFKPFIDRSYPLEQIVEAHRYVDTGRKRGNVIITVS